MTIVRGRFIRPDGTAIEGVQVEAILTDIGVEETTLDLISKDRVTTTSNGGGEWAMNLWATSDSPTKVQYQVMIKYPSGVIAQYKITVPDQPEVQFATLITNASITSRQDLIKSLEPVQSNFNLIQTTTLRKRWEFTDSNQLPINLSNWEVKVLFDDPTIITEYACIDSITTNAIKLKLLPSVTALMTKPSYKYEIFIVSTEDVIKVIEGTITVKPSLGVVQTSGV